MVKYGTISGAGKGYSLARAVGKYDLSKLKPVDMSEFFGKKNKQSYEWQISRSRYSPDPRANMPPVNYGAIPIQSPRIQTDYNRLRYLADAYLRRGDDGMAGSRAYLN